MLLFINLKKELKMLRQLLVASMLLVIFSLSSMGENLDIKDENQVLKLKLEIFELREQNRQLQTVIKNFNAETKNELRRKEAILKLKRELRMSRKTRGTSILSFR
jgi:hypothetical protein